MVHIHFSRVTGSLQTLEAQEIKEHALALSEDGNGGG